MPFYIYKCNNADECGKTSTYMVPRVGDAPTECRYCKSSDIKRIFDGQTVSAGKSKKADISKLESTVIGVMITFLPNTFE